VAQQPVYFRVFFWCQLEFYPRVLLRMASSLPGCDKRDSSPGLNKGLLVGRRRRERLLCETRGRRDVLVLHYMRFSHSCMLCCIVKLFRRSRADGMSESWALRLTQQQRHKLGEPMTLLWLRPSATAVSRSRMQLSDRAPIALRYHRFIIKHNAVI
jgi:hypothetical protein